MIKMKNLFSIALLFFMTLSVNAQDKKAKELLDDVTSKIKSYKTQNFPEFEKDINDILENLGR